MMMKKKKSSQEMGRRAWNVVRIALVWTRKGGAAFSFKKRRIMLDHFRTLPKFIKSLAALNIHQSKQDQRRYWDANAIQHHYYGERQLSFDETPVIHFRRPSSLRFNIPCINAPSTVDFDYDFEQDEDSPFEMYDNVARKSFLKSAEEEELELELDEDEEINEGSDEGIDRKAEEFIANFYQQIKMQRQISYLQYHDKNINGGSAPIQRE